MTTPHNLDSTRATLNTLPIDTEKHNHTSDTASSLERNIHDAADCFLGRFNVMIAMAIITTVLVFAIWIPASSNAGIVVFAALFGFTSGTIVSMAPALVAL